MPLASRSSASGLILLLLTASGVVACNKRKSEPINAASMRVLGRYWLTHTQLQSAGAKGTGFTVTAPRLVELLPNGYVRSIPNQEPQFEGLLPPEVLQEPQNGRGLMLYAQRVGEIHWRTPEGLLYGRVHPGAFVSVVPMDGLMVRIGNLPFKPDQGPLVVYVNRESLGTEPRELASLKAPVDTRSMRWSVPISGWIADPDEPNMKPAWSSKPCEDVWVSRDLKRVSQYVRGVEVIGIADSLTAPWPTIDAGGGISCPGRFIAHRGAQLVLCETTKPDNPNKPAEPRVVERIPEGYRTFELPKGDPLGNAIEQGASAYWLTDDGSGPKCDQWSFRLDDPRHRAKGRKGRLVRHEKWDRETAWFPMSYLPSEEKRLAVLHLGTIMLSGGGTMKCPCESDYAILRADEGELEVISQPPPDDIIAYDPSQTERWFLSAEKCQVARTQAAEALERDGSVATRLGFHAVLPGLQF